MLPFTPQKYGSPKVKGKILEIWLAEDCDAAN